MIEYIKTYGLLKDEAQVLVCTTNSVGAMGLGIAKLFREQIPKLYYRYRKHCQEHAPKDMVPYVFDRGNGKFVYCLHTKQQWWRNSHLDYVEKGLREFVLWCQANAITSIAMPPLGCGNGNLIFEGCEDPTKDVKYVMEQHLQVLQADIRIYCP